MFTNQKKLVIAREDFDLISDYLKKEQRRKWR